MIVKCVFPTLNVEPTFSGTFDASHVFHQRNGGSEQVSVLLGSCWVAFENQQQYPVDVLPSYSHTDGSESYLPGTSPVFNSHDGRTSTKRYSQHSAASSVTNFILKHLDLLKTMTKTTWWICLGRWQRFLCADRESKWSAASEACLVVSLHWEENVFI